MSVAAEYRNPRDLNGAPDFSPNTIPSSRPILSFGNFHKLISKLKAGGHRFLAGFFDYDFVFIFNPRALVRLRRTRGAY